MAMERPLQPMPQSWLRTRNDVLSTYVMPPMPESPPEKIMARLATAAVLTPPDPVSQIIMAIPLCLLYELCILILALDRRRSESPSTWIPS